LGKPEYTHEHVRLLVHKAGRLLSHATRGAADELMEELKRSQKQLETAMNKRETAVEHQTNVSITARSLEIDVAHQSAEVERLTGLHARIEAEIAGLEPDAAALRQRRAGEKAAAGELQSATKKLEDARARLAELSLSTGQTAAADQLARLATVKAELGALTGSLAATRADLAHAKSELARATKQAADWGVPVKHSSSSRPLPILQDSLARAEARLQALREQYDSQLDEFNQVTQRQSELATQIADLEAAEADLTQLVASLETLIRSRFRENFQALAEQFSVYFARLFDGGNASLELTEVEGEGYGIVIKASPAGKRLASIAALSGGERALAGVALVAAIMKVNPSPFVVLDEIDAALDESNSGRLAGILSELQQTSQLIVITHNRQTMRAAQVLFGVTLGEHHISSLISMRLEQATQLAAR
jgi:chromosome segregation protein